jgi:hypothetical protein
MGHISANFCTSSRHTFFRQILLLLLLIGYATNPFLQLAIQLLRPPKATFMSSLVYVGRIRSLSPEAARALESAGFHVKNFGPGEITTDECILVMTSDALLTGLEPSASAPAAVKKAAAPGHEFESMVRLLNQYEPAGTETAIWNRIKATATAEPGVKASAADPMPGSSGAPARKPEANLGFVPNQAGSRVLATSKQKVDGTSKFSSALPARAPEWQSGSAKPRPVGRPVTSIQSRDGRRIPRLWQPASIGAALLVLAVILLAGRASIVHSAGGTAIEDTAQSGSDAADSTRPSRAVNTPETKARRHVSDDDFVAKDYTTHFDLHGHPEPKVHTPELRRGAQNRVRPKRIVVN